MLSASERQTLAANQPLKTSRGYTGHEHLDRTGFIHMNGRLYDPQLGRFLSPDPIVAAPGSSQSWNSYSYVSNSPLSFVDPGGQFQAGIGCNVGYVMCMNGGNTSGGGASQGSETATIRTYQSHTVYVVDWEPSPTWNPGGGSIYGRGGIFGGGDINNGTHGDINGGIFGDVWGGHETIQYTPFVTTFSFDYWATETRQIQNPAEEQSPASKPMGAGVGEIGGSQEGTPQQNLNKAVSEFRRLYETGKIDAPWIKNYAGLFHASRMVLISGWRQRGLAFRCRFVYKGAWQMDSTRLSWSWARWKCGWRARTSADDGTISWRGTTTWGFGSSRAAGCVTSRCGAGTGWRCWAGNRERSSAHRGIAGWAGTGRCSSGACT